MKSGTRRYLAELIVSFLLVGFVVGCMTVVRYQSYLGEAERMAAILQSRGAEQDIFRILKGETGVSEDEAEELLGSYGYEETQDSAAGRQFRRDCIAMLLGGLILWFGIAGLLGVERYRKKKEQDRQYQEIVEQLEKIRRGEYLHVLPEYEDAGAQKITDALDSLGSYVEMIRSQAYREKEETKSLVTDLSHQLKTPVAALASCYDILKAPDLSKEERMEFQTRMELQLNSLEQLIGALINISRMETGMIHLQPENGKVFETILEAVNRIWVKAQKKEIDIQMDGENEISGLVIQHDRKWLCEALLNLLDNAVKYSPRGTAITIRAERMPSFLRIEIQDQGIGIPREDCHKVFQRFFRGQQPEVKKTEGAGVGLYLSRRIIEGHHGTLSLDTRKMKKEKGAVFVVRLPY
ncbi:MAG TPA: HAMP domain-containing histidine kinase [Candidatus Mediterraneibacter merdipullorum]|nr:HAMP domain-containing histidine kinase [Candidatus Mediterraneibacter merdipullorum]